MRILTSIFIFVAVSTACGRGQDVTYDKLSRDKDIYVRYLPANPDNLNPVIMRDVYSHYVVEYLIDKLYIYDNNNNFALKPLLAEGMPEISDDHKTFTIKIRKGGKWEDGVPVTAHDVAFTWKMVQSPEVDSGQSKSYYDDVEKFEAVDDYTFRFTMKKVYAFYANTLTMPHLVPAHIFKGMKEAKEFNAFKYPEGHPWAGTAYSLHPLSCGPYRLEKFEPQKECLLTRNDDYWGGKPEVRKVHFLIITDTVASYQYLKRGDLDTFNFNVPRQWETDGRNNDYVKANYEQKFYYRAVYYYVGWNMQRGVFKDKKVRQALGKLLNVDGIIKQVELGHARRCIGPYAAEFSQADKSVQPLALDKKGALALLEEAGWKDSDGDGIRDKDGKKFEFEFMITSKNPRAETTATVMQEDFKKAGIKVSIRALEWNAFSEEVNNQKFDAMMSGWASSDPEDDAYQIWHSSQAKDRGSNYVSFKNARVDELIEKCRLEFDRSKRDAMCQEINRIIYEEQPYCFLYHPEILAVVHKRFVTTKPSPLMGFDPRQASDWKIVGKER